MLTFCILTATTEYLQRHQLNKRSPMDDEDFVSAEQKLHSISQLYRLVLVLLKNHDHWNEIGNYASRKNSQITEVVSE